MSLEIIKRNNCMADRTTAKIRHIHRKFKHKLEYLP